MGLGFAAAWWWIPSTPVTGPLEPGWEAVTHVLAGDGRAGTADGDLRHARFSDPFGVAAAPDGTIFVADGGDLARVRAIAPAGFVYTIAGTQRGFADGPPSRARFDSPSGLARASDGTLYVADTGNDVIRRITPDGSVSTVATDVPLNAPMGVALDRDGRLVIADTYNDCIRLVDANGTTTTFTGPPELPFDTPAGVAVGPDGLIYVADTGNGLVRVIDPARPHVTAAGDPMPGAFGRPVALAAGRDGELYIADERGRLFEITAAGGTRIVAGSVPGYRGGPGPEAQFRRLGGVAILEPGRLVVADAGNALVRLVSARSLREWRLPDSPLIAPGFDDVAFDAMPLLWPVAPMEGPFEVAGTMGEARGGEGTERFHAGIDVRVEAGTPVRAVRDGVVLHAVAAEGFDTLDERLRIGPLTYVHIRAGRGPRGETIDRSKFVPTYDERGTLVRIRAKRGARFATGDVIGSVNRFNHVHLNVGWPGEEHNPLRFGLVQFRDTVPPTIARGGIRLFDEQWRPLTARVKGRLLVSGRVRIVVDAWDQAEGNTPSRRLGLHALGYQVLTPDGTPVDGFEADDRRIRFDRMLTGSDAARLVYAPGSGIPFYGQRRTRFLYTVTNRFVDGVATEGFWDTNELAPGPYIVRVLASDYAGNDAVTNRDLAVTVGGPPAAAADSSR